jgi:alpha-ketoglutarate-dependent 2,4-dichlorophenoxyacetate dioxygenase
VDIGEPLAPADARGHTGRHGPLRRTGVPARQRPLTTAQQLAFTQSLGELEPPYTPDTRRRKACGSTARALRHLQPGPGDRILPRDDRKRLFGLGNQMWHSDSSYKKVPARYSALNAHVIPPSGGDTEFADMRCRLGHAAPRPQGEGERPRLRAQPHLFQGRAGFPLHRRRKEHDFAPVRQPLVRTHPGSGRTSLYLSPRTPGRIVGWPVPEAMMMLRELTEHATQREFVYRHKWRVGRPRHVGQPGHHAPRPPFDDEKYPRDLRRTTLTCGKPAVAA